MSRDRDQDLLERRQRLLARSAELRVTLVSRAQVLEKPLAVVDVARAGVQWVRQHPEWVMGAGLVLVTLRPRRALRWATRVWWLWRTVRRTRRWLAAGSAGPM